MNGPANVRGPVAAMPLGLQALYERCLQTYPNQSNPLQVNALVKYW